MASIDLAARYGKGRTHSLVNRAIRAELVGGDHCLNALDSLRCLEHDWEQRGWTQNLTEIRAAISAIEMVKAGMGTEICRRYGMTPRERP